jgi:dipeptidyl aminopeptidase/acylaminoacyl peptidase
VSVALLILLATLVAGALLVSLLTFWRAVRPPRLSIPLRPADVGLEVRDITIVAEDGVALHGWLAPRPGAPSVVVLHGYPAEKAEMLPIAAALAPHFSVLLMDLRYFGGSGGGATTLGVRERGDLRRAVDVLVAQGTSPVGVFGLSFGGAVAIMTAAEDPRIRAIAAYAPFSDLKTLGRELYGWLWLAKYPFVELMALWGRLLLGVDLGVASPKTAARHLTTPVLLIASREDDVIRFHHAEALQAALRGNPAAEFLVMSHGRHGELPADFGSSLARFFRAHLISTKPDEEPPGPESLPASVESPSREPRREPARPR